MLQEVKLKCCERCLLANEAKMHTMFFITKTGHNLCI